MTTLDTQAQKYLADVRAIKASYDAEAHKHHDKLLAVERECNERLHAARIEYRQSAINANDLYRERLAQAAKIRADKASDEIASDIREACNTITALCGGACHDEYMMNDDVVRARLEQLAETRERARLEKERDKGKHGRALFIL